MSSVREFTIIQKWDDPDQSIKNRNHEPLFKERDKFLISLFFFGFFSKTIYI